MPNFIPSLRSILEEAGKENSPTHTEGVRTWDSRCPCVFQLRGLLCICSTAYLRRPLTGSATSRTAAWRSFWQTPVMTCGWGTAGATPGPENTWNSHPNLENTGPSGKELCTNEYECSWTWTNTLGFSPYCAHTTQGIHEKETNISSSTQAFFTSPEEMPLFAALLFVLKTYLLVCVCACKVHMQKKKSQNAKVVFRKVISRTITLSLWTPEEAYMGCLLKRKTETDREVGQETRFWVKILRTRHSW